MSVAIQVVRATRYGNTTIETSEDVVGGNLQIVDEAVIDGSVTIALSIPATGLKSIQLQCDVDVTLTSQAPEEEEVVLEAGKAVQWTETDGDARKIFSSVVSALTAVAGAAGTLKGFILYDPTPA